MIVGARLITRRRSGSPDEAGRQAGGLEAFMETPDMIIAMLVWFEVKHFVADYLLQRRTGC